MNLSNILAKLWGTLVHLSNFTDNEYNKRHPLFLKVIFTQEVSYLSTKLGL